MPNDKAVILAPDGRPAKTADELIGQGALDLDDLARTWEQTVFCLDCSGSMYSSINFTETTSKIDLLKKAMDRYLRDRYKKHPNSRVGLVTFNSDASTLIDVSDNEQMLLALVRDLHGDGSTRMDVGLNMALNILQRTAAQYTPRVVLISDGQPDSQERVVQVIEQHRDMRVTIDAIYIGPVGDYENMYVQFMRMLAQRTNGVFEMISSEADFERKFLKVAARALLTAGRLQIPDQPK